MELTTKRGWADSAAVLGQGDQSVT